MKQASHRLIVSALFLATGVACATEGGGSTYPRGVENYGVGAVPPPGLYWLAYGDAYSADRLNGDDGKALSVPGFKVNAAVAVVRPVLSTAQSVLGGNLVFHAVIPLVDLKVKAAGASQNKSGLGDVTLGVGIAKHHSPQLHTAMGLDVSLPTGGYRAGDLANIGRNHLSVQPLYAISYIDPNGFNGDVKFTLNLNRTNKDTNFRSGNELFVDYAAGWGLGNGWTIGVGGTVWEQLGNDKSNGVEVANNKVSSLAIGPSIKYDNGKGWFFTAKLQKEVSVNNSTAGTSFWVKTILPF